MKLHLPKGLRTAIIAAISIFSGFTATLDSAYAADLTWGQNKNSDETGINWWTANAWLANGGTKTTFQNGDNVVFDNDTVAFLRIKVDKSVQVGTMTTKADTAYDLAGSGNEDLTITTLSMGGNDSYVSLNTLKSVTIDTITSKAGSTLAVSSSGCDIVVKKVMENISENLFLALSGNGAPAVKIKLAGNYTNDTKLQAAINSIYSTSAAVDDNYTYSKDLSKMGVLVFTDKQGIQPGTTANIVISERKVVFDKGITLIGHSNSKEFFTIKPDSEVTVNGLAFENMRMTVKVEGGKLTATEGILLGHTYDGNNPGWMSINRGEIITANIKGQNNTVGTSFTMEEKGPEFGDTNTYRGTLTITSDSAFGLTASGKKLNVNLNAGTLTSTATAMSLVESGSVNNTGLVINVGGNFNILAQEGKAITLNHTVSGAGTLVLNGDGTVEIAEGLSLDKVSIKQEKGTLALADSLTLGEGASISQTAGSKIKLATLSTSGDSGSYTNYEGGAAGNGFSSGQADVIIGGTIDGNLTVNFNGTDYTLTNTDRSISVDTDYSTYYVNVGSEDMSKIAAASSSLAAIKLAGGNLVLDVAPADSVKLQATKDSTLTINQGVSFNQSDLKVDSGKTVTLTGSGTYEITKAFSSDYKNAAVNPTMEAKAGAGWTGTVKLTGGAAAGLNVDNYAYIANPNDQLNTAGNSTVELNGVQGHLAGSGTSYYLANIILTNATDNGKTYSGFTMTDANSDATSVYTGKFSGTGDFERLTGAGSTQTIAFYGDLSEWTGSFIANSTAATTLNIVPMSGNAVGTSILQKKSGALTVGINIFQNFEFNGSIGIDEKATGTITLNILGTGEKTFNNEVTATTVTVNESTTTFKNSLTATTLTLSKGATLDLSAATATIGTLNLDGGSTLVLSSTGQTVSNLNLNGTTPIVLNGIATNSTTILFTGLEKETSISGIAFTEQNGKRAVQASNYFSGVSDSAWLVYDGDAQTLSLRNTLSDTLYWDNTSSAWNASVLWADEKDGTPNSQLPLDSGKYDVCFSGGTGVNVNLEAAATVAGITIENGSYTFTGKGLTPGPALAVKDAEATFNNSVDLSSSIVTVSGAGSKLTLGQDSTIQSLSNEGTLDLAGNALTLSTATTKGGTVNAGNVTLTGENTFTQLTASGAVTGATALTVGGTSSMGSLANDTALTVTDGTTTIQSDATLKSLAGSGSLATTGDLVLTNGGSIGGLDVAGGTLTLTSGTLTVTGALSGVNHLEVGTLPADGPVITAGSITGASLAFATTETTLSGLKLDFGDSWTLIKLTDEGATAKVSFLLGSVDKGDIVAFDDCKYVLSQEGGDITISKARGGNEWYGSSDTITWDGTDAGWTSKAPSATAAANFLGNGPSTVTVVGEQSTSKLVVNTEFGTTKDYTLTGDAVTVEALAIESGKLTIGNTVTATDTDVKADGGLTITANGSLTTDKITVDDSAQLIIESGASVDVKSDVVPGSLLANNAGTVTLNALNGGDGDIVGGTIQLREGSTSTGTYTGSYKEGTKVIAKGGNQTLNVTRDLSIEGNAGSTIVLSTGPELGSINTTGANVGLSANSVALASDSSMSGGELDITFSAAHAIAHAGDKAGVEKAFTGAAIHLNGVTVNIKQSETDNNIAIVPNDSMGTTGIVLFTISDVSGSTFDETTKIGEIDAPMLDKYFTNFSLGKGSVYVLVDLNLTHYSSTLKAQTENGAAGIHMADNALARIAPQEGANRAQYKDLANVLDAMDNFGPQDAVAADRFAAAFAGASTAILGSAVAGDMDRQLLSIRNRTTSMGCVSGALMEDDTMPSFWFNAEGDYRRIKSAGTAAGYNMSSWGATVGADYNVNTNTTLGLAVTSMFGKLSVSSADHTTGDMNAYYVTGIARYARGAWVNTFIASVGITDLTLDRTVAVPGASSYTTHGSTSGVSFGMMYELAYTIPMNSEASTCLQPVFNIAIKHTTVDSYHETGSDAALHVGSQSLTSVSFGLGGRLQTTIGETLYNRASVLEMRAMAKLEAGDRYSSADVSLAAKDSIRGSVKSAEKETLGLELGAGLFIPLGVDNGTLFFDVSAEIRQDAPSVNGTVGYRLTF